MQRTERGEVGRGRRRFVAVIALTAGVGCAWNYRGLVDVSCAANSSTRELSMDAWGLHLVTLDSQATLALGHSRSMYVFPTNAPVPDVAAGALLKLASPEPLASVAGSECREVGDAFDPRGPYLHRALIDGLSLSVGASRVGVSLGRRSAVRLSVPDGGAYVVRVRSNGDDAAIEASMRRTE